MTFSSTQSGVVAQPESDLARYRKALGQTAALAPRANQALAEVERMKASVEHERQRMEQEQYERMSGRIVAP